MYMHPRRFFLITGILLIPVLFLSCGLLGSKPPTRNYYILSYNLPQKAVNSPVPHLYSLQIGRFEVQRIFNRQNIAYRYSANRLQYYDFQQWAVRPDYMISDLVFKHLDSAGIFNRIGTEFLDAKPDFRLEGTVDALEKFDAGDIFFGHLAMSFKMVRADNGQQVWEYSFDERKRVYQPEMVYTVVAISHNLQEQMNIVVSQIDSLMSVMNGGASRKVQPAPVPQNQTAGQDTTVIRMKTPGYEIIPESRINRK